MRGVLLIVLSVLVISQVTAGKAIERTNILKNIGVS